MDVFFLSNLGSISGTHKNISWRKKSVCSAEITLRHKFFSSPMRRPRYGGKDLSFATHFKEQLNERREKHFRLVHLKAAEGFSSKHNN